MCALFVFTQASSCCQLLYLQTAVIQQFTLARDTSSPTSCSVTSVKTPQASSSGDQTQDAAKTKSSTATANPSTSVAPAVMKVFHPAAYIEIHSEANRSDSSFDRHTAENLAAESLGIATKWEEIKNTVARIKYVR